MPYPEANANREEMSRLPPHGAQKQRARNLLVGQSEIVEPPFIHHGAISTSSCLLIQQSRREVIS